LLSIVVLFILNCQVSFLFSFLLLNCQAAAAKGQAPPGLPLKGAGQDSQDVLQKVLNHETSLLKLYFTWFLCSIHYLLLFHTQPSNGGIPKPTDALSGELWEVKKGRIKRCSVHGKLPGWDLRSVRIFSFFKLPG
jgi:phosphatidylinositol 4-kinase B